MESQNTNIQGAIGSLEGETEDTEAKATSRASVGVLEVRGRGSKNKGQLQKRTKKVLEMWDQGPTKGKKEPASEPKAQTDRSVKNNQRRGSRISGNGLRERATLPLRRETRTVVRYQKLDLRWKNKKCKHLVRWMEWKFFPCGQGP